MKTSFPQLRAGGAFNSLYAGLGAKGHDVVSYFTDGKPVAGEDAYIAEHAGLKWQFASAEHRDLFKADPARYLPQYGGFCSWGVANGKLYLNFNADIQKMFDKDAAGFIARADGNWPGL